MREICDKIQPVYRIIIEETAIIELAIILIYLISRCNACIIIVKGLYEVECDTFKVSCPEISRHKKSTL